MLFYIAIFLIPLITWIILRTISKRRANEASEPPILLEVCALCHEEFEMRDLIEKEVGEYGRVYCFCGGCIENLQREYRQQKEVESLTEDAIFTQQTRDTEN